MGPARFRLAICGAGIGGLTLAIALSKYPDIDVDIYEGASKISEIGAGIGLWPRPWCIIEELGLARELLATTDDRPTSDVVSGLAYRKSDQFKGLPFFTLQHRGNLIKLHRCDYQKVLLDRLSAVKAARLTCSKRLSSYRHCDSGIIQLRFADGTSAWCDVLVGADGFKSSVRANMLRREAAKCSDDPEKSELLMSCIAPSWSGTNAYRGVVLADVLNARFPGHRCLKQGIQYIGKSGFIIAYPIQHGSRVNVAAFAMRHDLEGSKFHDSWAAHVSRDEFATSFKGWEPEAQALIDCIDSPLRWAIHTVRPLPSFISEGSVALLGDAAHAMCPHQGSGAGQAIEDAYLLAALLGSPLTTRSSIPRALEIYDQIRRPQALEVQERSRLSGQYNTLYVDGMQLDQLRGESLLSGLQQLSRKISKNWEWAWLTTPDASLQEALHLLDH